MLTVLKITTWATLVSALAVWSTGVEAKDASIESAAAGRSSSELVAQLCHGCHGARPRHYAGDDRPFAFLQDWARDRRLITAAAPERSPLYWTFLLGHTHARNNVWSEETSPATAQELNDLRDWIAKLPARRTHLGRPPRGKLTLRLNHRRYREGQPIRLTVEAAERCFLTLVLVDATGSGTVLYPNGYDERAPILPGERLSLPPNNARYAFKATGATAPGTILAICTSTDESVVGVQHDFIQQRFTTLGPWQRHLADWIERGQGIEPLFALPRQRLYRTVVRTRRVRRRGRWRRIRYRRRIRIKRPAPPLRTPWHLRSGEVAGEGSPQPLVLRTWAQYRVTP